MRANGLSAADKSAVTAACQQLIDDFLKPRFLLTIRPTQFNYPVDILGKWHGTKYRFIQRYRSSFLRDARFCDVTELSRLKTAVACLGRDRCELDQRLEKPPVAA